jgi:hypothetical protein
MKPSFSNKRRMRLELFRAIVLEARRKGTVSPHQVQEAIKNERGMIGSGGPPLYNVRSAHSNVAKRITTSGITSNFPSNPTETTSLHQQVKRFHYVRHKIADSSPVDNSLPVATWLRSNFLPDRISLTACHFVDASDY